MKDSSSIAPNTIAFMALCKEYCVAIENAAETEPADFIDTMLRLLPRLYISASDITSPGIETDCYITPALNEDYYDAVRRRIEIVMGEDDTYLEVFLDDMKYSDTPIAASISEGLADLFQEFYNVLSMVDADAPTGTLTEIATAAKENFQLYWSRTLCNILRALNEIKYRQV